MGKNIGNKSDSHSGQVIKTLETLVNILSTHEIEYRFLGSIIPAAVAGRVHRKLSDLDMLVDKNKAEMLSRELIKKGFIKTKKNHLRIAEQLNLYIFNHPDLLEISFYGIDFLPDGSGQLISDGFKAVLFPETIAKTEYFLSGIKFIGLPAAVIYKTGLYNKHNPKRKIDFEIFDNNDVKPFKENIYKLTYKGFDLTFLSRVPNFVLEIIGVIRMAVGKNYDIWK